MSFFLVTSYGRWPVSQFRVSLHLGSSAKAVHITMQYVARHVFHLLISIIEYLFLFGKGRFLESLRIICQSKLCNTIFCIG